MIAVPFIPCDLDAIALQVYLAQPIVSPEHCQFLLRRKVALIVLSCEIWKCGQEIPKHEIESEPDRISRVRAVTDFLLVGDPFRISVFFVKLLLGAPPGLEVNKPVVKLRLDIRKDELLH